VVPTIPTSICLLVAANLQVPYWQAAGAGFDKAGKQMKVRTDFLGPNNYDAKAERDAPRSGSAAESYRNFARCDRSGVAERQHR